jgi:hypothetical protein
MLFGGGNRYLMAARIGLLVVFMLAVFVFHAHGETLEVLQVVRIVALIALVGSAWAVRRRGRS